MPMVSDLEAVKDTILRFNNAEITEAQARFILRYAYRESGVWVEEMCLDEVLGVAPKDTDPDA